MPEATFNLTSSYNEGQKKAHITPGIWPVQITGLDLKKNSNEKDYLSIAVQSLDGTREHEEQMFLSTEKAVEWTKKRLSHLFEAIFGVGSAPGDIVFSELRKRLVGSKVRIVFQGEEIETKKGNRMIVTNMKFMNFAENINVPENQSNLKYSPERDIKMMTTKVDPLPWDQSGAGTPSTPLSGGTLKF
jgi:hypothetical protein